MIDQSRGAARRRSLFARLQAVLRAFQSDPVFRRRLAQSPFEALGLSDDASASNIYTQLKAPPQSFEAAVTGLLVFGDPAISGSATPPLEARLTAMGLRPAALLHMTEAEATLVLRWGEAHGLYGFISYHQWSNQADEGKGGYSNSTGALSPASPGSGGMRSLILSTDPDRAVLGWIAVALGWDEVVGQVLGYPDCCRRFFDESWPSAREDHQGDVAPLTLAASGEGPFDWRLNVFARYFGAGLLSHFPCRFDCPASLAEARRLEAALSVLDPQIVETARAVMQGVVLYTETDGVALATDTRVIDGACDSDRWRVSNPDGRLARALAGGAAPCRETDAIRIGDDLIPGAMIAFGAVDTKADVTAARPLAEEAILEVT